MTPWATQTETLQKMGLSSDDIIYRHRWDELELAGLPVTKENLSNAALYQQLLDKNSAKYRQQNSGEPSMLDLDQLIGAQPRAPKQNTLPPGILPATVTPRKTPDNVAETDVQMGGGPSWMGSIMRMVAPVAEDVISHPLNYITGTPKEAYGISDPSKILKNVPGLLPKGELQKQLNVEPERKTGPIGALSTALPTVRDAGKSVAEPLIETEDPVNYLFRQLNTLSAVPAAGLKAWGEYAKGTAERPLFDREEGLKIPGTQQVIPGTGEFFKNVAEYQGLGKGFSDLGAQVGKELQTQAPTMSRAMVGLSTLGASEIGRATGYVVPPDMSNMGALLGFGADILTPGPGELAGLAKGVRETVKPISAAEKAVAQLPAKIEPKLSEEVGTRIQSQLRDVNANFPLIDQDVVLPDLQQSKNNLVLHDAGSVHRVAPDGTREMGSDLFQVLAKTDGTVDVARPLGKTAILDGSQLNKVEGTLAEVLTPADVAALDDPTHIVVVDRMDALRSGQGHAGIWAVDPKTKALTPVGVGVRLNNDVLDAGLRQTGLSKPSKEDLTKLMEMQRDVGTLSIEINKKITAGEKEVEDVLSRFTAAVREKDDMIERGLGNFTKADLDRKDREISQLFSERQATQREVDALYAQKNDIAAKRKMATNSMAMASTQEGEAGDLARFYYGQKAKEGQQTGRSILEARAAVGRGGSVPQSAIEAANKATQGTLPLAADARLADNLASKQLFNKAQALKKQREIADEASRTINERGSFFKAPVKTEDDIERTAASSLQTEYSAELNSIPAQWHAVLRTAKGDVDQVIRAVMPTDPKAWQAVAKEAISTQIERDLRTAIQQSKPTLSNAALDHETQLLIENAMLYAGTQVTRFTRPFSYIDAVQREFLSSLDDAARQVGVVIPNLNFETPGRVAAKIFVKAKEEEAAKKVLQKMTDMQLATSRASLDALPVAFPDADKATLQRAFVNLVKQHLDPDKENFGLQKVIEGLSAATGKDYEQTMQLLDKHDILLPEMAALEREVTRRDLARSLDNFLNDPDATKKLAAAVSELGAWSNVPQALIQEKAKTLLQSLAKVKNNEELPGLLRGIDSFLSKQSSILRSSMTSGTAWPNMRYLMQNLITGPLIVYGQLGARSAIGSMIEFPMAASIAARISMNPLTLKMSRDGAQAVVKIDGQIVTVADLAERIPKLGLGSTQASFELSGDILDRMADVLERETKTNSWGKMLRNYVGAGPNPNMWAQVASDTDQSFRIAVYLDALRSGEPEAVAIRKAREALFDYGSLSAVEKSYLARNVFFYSFMRHSAVNAFDMLITPKGQTTLKNAMMIAYRSPADEMQQQTEATSGRPMLRTHGAVSPEYAMFGPGVPQSDAVETLAEIAGLGAIALASITKSMIKQSGQPLTDDFGTAAVEFARNHALNPYFEIAALLLTEGKGDLRTGRTYGDKGPDPKISAAWQATPFWDAYKNTIGLKPDLSDRTKDRWLFVDKDARMRYVYLQKLIGDTLFPVLIGGRGPRDLTYLKDPRLSTPEKILSVTGVITPIKTNDAWDSYMKTIFQRKKDKKPL